MVRSDTEKGLPDIKVKGNAGLGVKPSAGKKALADFGTVQPKSYEITIELTQEQSALWVSPDPTTVDVAQGAAQENTIIIDPKVELRVILTGYDAKASKDIALKDLDWKLSGAATVEGKTGADGLIKAAISEGAESAVIELTYPEGSPKIGAEPKPAAAAEDYPIKIQPDAYKDKNEGDVLEGAGDRTVKWQLALADLADGEGDDGIKGRLWNLGFPASDDAAKTTAAVQAYQWLYEGKFDASGALGDVKADVKKRHDDA